MPMTGALRDLTNGCAVSAKSAVNINTQLCTLASYRCCNCGMRAALTLYLTRLCVLLAACVQALLRWSRSSCRRLRRKHQ
jgi:hypothetical protein